MLSIQGLGSGYGGDVICHDISLVVEPREIVCVLGRNGVGKTTLLRTILGKVALQAGSIEFDGRDIGHLASDKIAHRGIGYVPQGRQLFGKLSVRDNLRLGSVARAGRLEEPDEAILDYFPVLRERLGQTAETLSGGEQQMVAIARVLQAKPKLLLCDEPSEGLQPSIIDDVGRVLRAVAKDLGAAILLVEQNIRLAKSTASRGYVIEGGTVVSAGSIDEITSEEMLHQHVAFSRMRATRDENGPR
ncbi:MAG: ABC transporter ATP-binding protein [Chloroflexota bacterium]|nr:MAG: ABC transporter ATP-binding protein [Chloroflexota bacterium]